MTLEQYLKSKKPKISHAAFAELVGVSQVTINRYIRGDRFPNKKMIEKIHLATNAAVTAGDWYSLPKVPKASKRKALAEVAA